MAADQDDELEYTLLNKREVHVYQIPPASSSAGHKADDWKTPIWRGRCRIAGKGQDLSIKMIDSSSGKLFAQCTIPGGDFEKYVERVIDSSRYFVLKITNGQRHAFIGLGFEERNDAFDFNCTLADFKNTWVDRDKQVEELPTAQEPAKDLSLKEGQKITINLRGMEGRSRRREESAQASGSGFAGLLAPPPPSSSQTRRQQTGAQPGVQPVLAPPPMAAPAPTAAAAPAPAAAEEDFFGDFADFQSAATPAPPTSSQATESLGTQLGQLSLGGAPPQAASPMSADQPGAFPAAPPADPFPGFAAAPGNPNQSTVPVPMAAPAQTTMQGMQPQAAFAPMPQGSSPARKAGRGDPFDEFDIFK
mmetsp:Transcript_59714/g.134615  ORF Transcript_59714/g.134615 Transcript_59714/m.134615 type:complete len:362 (-) Transcript_59714:84-1169(-)